MECPISAILECIVLKEVTLSLSWSFQSAMLALFSLLMSYFGVLESE